MAIASYSGDDVCCQLSTMYVTMDIPINVRKKNDFWWWLWYRMSLVVSVMCIPVVRYTTIKPLISHALQHHKFHITRVFQFTVFIHFTSQFEFPVISFSIWFSFIFISCYGEYFNGYNNNNNNYINNIYVTKIDHKKQLKFITILTSILIDV